MTIKDLQRLITEKQGADSTELINLIQKIRNRPFWIENVQEHMQKYKQNNGNCCFNNIIGLPQKHGIQKPLFDYELNILRLLDSHKYIWIKKSTGLGITEFFLRYVIWRCLYNEDWKGRQVPIVVGPNLDLAIKLIKRIKKMFESKHNIYFEDRQTVLELNGVLIQAFPSNHLSSFRSLESPALIFMDESDYFGPNEQNETRTVAERYIGKSDPFIILVSTPNAPGAI